MTEDGFINEFQKRHYEACKKADAVSRRQPMLPGEGNLRSQWLHEMASQEKKTSFLDWVVKRDPDRSEIWKRTLKPKVVGNRTLM